MTEIPDWALSTPPNPAVHNAPAPPTQWEGMPQNQIDMLRGQLLESIVSTITQALTGLFLPGPFGAAFEQLKAWGDNISDAVIEALSALFARIEAATGVDLSALLPLFAPLDFTHGPAAFFQSLIEHVMAVPNALGAMIMGVLEGILSIPEHLGNLVNTLRDFFLGPNSPLSAFNIFGLLQSWNLPFLPISSLTNEMPNLLVAPGFTGSDSIAATENDRGWFWDDDDGRTDPGCARVDVVAGVQQILQSVSIPVAYQQKVKAHVWVKWVDLTYTSTDPILLDLVRFDAEGFEVGKTTLESISSPAGSSAGDWFKIDGPEYVIPNDGTAQVVIEFRARETATGGSVWWDDAELKKTNQTIPQNWVLNLVPDLGGIRDWIQDVIDGIISAIRGIPFVGGTLADMITWITGWQEDTDEAAGVATDAYIGLGVTQKIITAAAQGQPLPDGTITLPQDDEVLAALQGQTSTIVAQGAQIEALQSASTGAGNSGVSVLDDFEYDAVTDLEDTGHWQRFIVEGTDPKVATDGHNAHAVNDGTSIYLYTGDGRHTITDYQKISATISSKLVYPGFGDGRRPHQAAVCRMSDDGTKWVRAYWNNVQQLVVDYRNGGSTGDLYVSAADAYRPPGPGENLSIEPGVGVNLRHFRVWRGATPLRTVIDGSALTYVGSDARGHGIGMRIASGYGAGSFTQYSAVDNAPAETRGVGFRAYRSGGGISKGGSGDTVFPANCLDTVDRITPGFTWDAATQQLTIAIEGWYLFGVQVEGGDIKGITGVGTYARQGLLYKTVSGTPTVVARFGEVGIQTTSGDPNSQVGLPISTVGNGVPIHYAEAGSVWSPGEWASVNHDITGSADGSETWFSVALLNRSTA